MTTRQELLDRWRSRLYEAEEACEDPQTDSWSARMRRKLYWFLLTMYGRADWPGPKDDVDNEAGRRKNIQLVIAEPQAELAGKEPRTRAEILTGLRNVTGLSEELAPAGPLAEGLLPHSPVLVATFKTEQLAKAALEMLRRRGFAPQVARHGRLVQVYVAATDLAEASAALREIRVKGVPPARIRSQPVDPSLSLFTGTFFGFAFCLTFGLLVSDVVTAWSQANTTNIPSPEQFWGLGIGSVICLLLSLYLCRNWYRQVSGWTDVARSLILLGACWLLLIGIGSLFVIFVMASPHFRIPRPEMIPSLATMDWGAFGGAACIVVSVLLLWARGYLPVGDRAAALGAAVQQQWDKTPRRET